MNSTYSVFQWIKCIFIVIQILLLVLSVILFVGSLVLFYVQSSDKDLEHNHKRESQRVLLFFCSLANLGTILSSIGIYGSLVNDKLIVCAYALIVFIVMFAVIVFVGNVYEVCALWALFVFSTIYAFLISKYEHIVYDVRTGNV